MHRLQLAIETPSGLRQEREIALRRGRHRFDHVLERITVHAAQEIEGQDRDLGIGEVKRVDLPLCEIARDRGVVRKIAVMDESFVHADEGMGAPGVPHPSLRRIAVVADPNVRAKVLEAVGSDDVLSVADHLQDEHVLSVGEDERALLPSRGVELPVQTVGILVDDLVLRGPRIGGAVGAHEFGAHLIAHPNEVAPTCGGGTSSRSARCASARRGISTT